MSVAADTAQRRGQKILQRLGKLQPLLFIAPFIAVLAAFHFYTYYVGVRMSFTDAQSINPGEWIGVSNYVEALTDDPDFWAAIRHTIYFTVGGLLTQIPGALILAVILNGITGRLRGALRTSDDIPVLINTVVAALIFRMMFNRDTGLINWTLGRLGLPNNTNWLYDSAYSVPLMVAVAFWQWVGYHMVYLLASLQAIDPQVYEVAKLDGASPLRVLFQITIPLLRPALTFVSVTSAIGCLQVFEYPFLLFPNAGYGPGKAAMTAIPFIYRNAFSSQFRYGYAAAAGWIVFFMILAVSLLQLRVLGLSQAEDL